MALKLTDSDKKTIVELYQHPEESTATLASRYAVSSSTISRILKQALSPTEYQSIVQQKKGGGSKPQTRKASANSTSSKTSPKSAKSSSPAKPKLKSAVVSGESVDAVPDENTSASDKPKVSPAKSAPSRGRKRQRSSAKGKPQLTPQASTPPEDVLESVIQLTTTDIPQEPESQGIEDVAHQPEVQADQSLYADEIEVDSSPDELVHEIQADLLDEEFDDDIDEDDVDLEDDDIDDDLEDDNIDATLEFPLGGDHLAILPFSEAKLPRTCYIIIDRSAELITRPLKTFADLGTVPEAEINEPTLPIFDNHKVAKRFANRRTQRIVKVPDARVLRKTSPYLMDKGITRLLLDGQVYALLDEDLE